MTKEELKCDNQFEDENPSKLNDYPRITITNGTNGTNNTSTFLSLDKDEEKYFTKQDNMYICGYSECEKKCDTLKKMKKHIKSHINKKNIYCRYEGCTKRFTSKNNLKVNLNIISKIINIINIRYITERILEKDLISANLRTVDELSLI